MVEGSERGSVFIVVRIHLLEHISEYVFYHVKEQKGCESTYTSDTQWAFVIA